MDFGGAFDDSLFAEPRSREATPLKSYNAKICVPKWFLDAEANDETEQINLEKYRADYYYSTKDFDSSLTHFQKCLDLVPESNMSMRRDIYESITRCHLHLGSHEQALQLAKSQYGDALNFEQKTNTLRILLDVYSARNDTMAEALAIERSILLHPMHVDLWLGLAEAYLKIDEQEPLMSEDGAKEEVVQPFFSDIDKHHYVSTCCVRVSGLLDYSVRMGRTFALEKLTKQREKVNEILGQLSLSQEYIDLCVKNICVDMGSPQDSTDDNNTEEAQTKPEVVVSRSDCEVHQHFVKSWILWKSECKS